MHKNYRYSYFYNRKIKLCSQFLLNHPIFGKTGLKLAFASIFKKKNDEKMAREENLSAET